MIDLKPCPFCGSKDLHIHGWSFYVQCMQCGAEGGWNDEQPRGEEVAIAAWNTRCNLTQLKEQND